MSQNHFDCHSPNDFFSRQALELSFRLLRNNNPGLANAIKKALDQINAVPYDLLHKVHTGEMYLNSHLLAILDVHIIGKIVSALTEIGKEALHNQDLPGEHLVLLRHLINDWVQLTEWILNTTSQDKSASL